MYNLYLTITDIGTIAYNTTYVQNIDPLSNSIIKIRNKISYFFHLSSRYQFWYWYWYWYQVSSMHKIVWDSMLHDQ